MTARLVVYRSKSLLRRERWRWHLLSGNQLVAESGEGYANRDECEQMARQVIQGGYSGAVLDRR